MKENLNKLIKSIQKNIDTLDKMDIHGPIPYLEEAIENVEAALEEWEMYLEEVAE